MEAETTDAKKVEFVSGILRNGETLCLESTETMALVVSNLCIPEVDPANASLVSRVFACRGDRTLLATLVPGVSQMQTINYKVPPAEKVALEVVGPHPVHVIGYRFSLEDDSSDSEILFVEEEEEEEEEEEAKE